MPSDLSTLSEASSVAELLILSYLQAIEPASTPLSDFALATQALWRLTAIRKTLSNLSIVLAAEEERRENERELQDAMLREYDRLMLERANQASRNSHPAHPSAPPGSSPSGNCNPRINDSQSDAPESSTPAESSLQSVIDACVAPAVPACPAIPAADARSRLDPAAAPKVSVRRSELYSPRGNSPASWRRDSSAIQRVPRRDTSAYRLRLNVPRFGIGGVTHRIALLASRAASILHSVVIGNSHPVLSPIPP